jgi:hypothetical protein
MEEINCNERSPCTLAGTWNALITAMSLPPEQESQAEATSDVADIDMAASLEAEH